MIEWLAERLGGKNPLRLHRRGQQVGFASAEEGVGYLEGEEGLQFAYEVIERQLRTLQREEPHRVRLDVFEDPNGDVEPGIYCPTYFTPEELDRSQALRQAYGTIVTHALVGSGLIENGQMATFSVSRYRTTKNYAIYRIDVIDVPKVR